MLYIPLSFPLPPVEYPDMFCIYWMNIFVFPCLSSVIKHPNSLFHLKNRKVNGDCEWKAPKAINQLFKRNRKQEVPDLKQWKYGKPLQLITGPYRALKWLKVIKPCLHSSKVVRRLLWAYMSVFLFFFLTNASWFDMIVSKAFPSIPCFTYQIILLSGYVIK